eukprot:jgi/Psemu1/69261/estExt_Genemark1.C_7780014
MSSLPPGKMKAYLSTVKETFLDKPPPGGALGDSFLGVLKMELFLRGILVEDEKKIWSQIQASVGKSLLVEQSASKIPKALLAGANVIAGRVVEAFYNKLTTAASLQSGRDVNGSSNSDFLRHLVPDEETSGARQRAEDIQDERWLFLLLHRKRQSPTGDDVTFEDYTNGLLQVALGCYTTAALIQSDTPPMWKKLWDVWTLLEKAASLSDNDASNKSDVYPPFEAQVAIENLIRIALSKNNAKRASELQLRLVQSYLNPNRIALVEVSLVSTQKRKAGTTSITIAECFGDSMTNDILPSKNDKASEDLVLAERARSTLETSQGRFFGNAELRLDALSDTSSANALGARRRKYTTAGARNAFSGKRRIRSRSTFDKADAELLNGGFMQHANEHYISVIAQLQEKDCFIDKHCASLLLAHCYNGMARIEHADQQYTDYNVAEESCTKKSLEILENLDLPSVIPSLSIWNLRSTFISSKTHALSVTRQLIADSLIHFERFGEARSFLQKAVADSPLDCEAALALGAFLLRVTFYLSKERSVEKAKEAQVHLLKAAKLDPSKPNPFALLGIWYEESKDLKRALGCYMKSLKLEPCNPVAGRGLLRLSPSENNRFFLESAINKSSPFNGWAWCAVGRGKAYSDGDDGLAVVAILKALRCRDIAFPDKESLGLFYNNPSFQVENEKSAALAEVGMCYRRLGRMTASIRAFRASIEAVGLKSVQSATLISCAQVEQELGLFDEAAEKFAIVIGREENTSRSVALYGHSMALFSIAERDLMDGKAGAAFARIELAVENCLNSSILSGCEYKLLGDLYSFGASFPANVFCDDNSKILDVNLLIEKQLEFVSKGEEAFRSCLSAQSHFYSDDEEGIATKSSILSDIASNILLQGQLLSPLGSNNQKVNDKYSIAAEAFRQAIEYNPIHAASWCGLGCSVRKTDPLLAQHAFSRCVQIESMCPDAYANAGFLYTSRLAFRASRSTMEALTQVADTPMMWMNCAFVLEREAEKSLVGENEGKSEDFISQAADAYRASLQVMRHPEAQLGLSLTGRVVPSHKQIKNDVPLSRLSALKRRDSFSFMKEYLDASLNEIGPALIFQGVMSMEKGLSGPSHEAWQNEIYMEGKEKTRLTQTNPRIFEISLSGPSGQKLEASIKTLMAEEEKTRGAFTVSANEVNQVNLQREIWLQPDRADLWLSLAKSFIEDGAVESAKTAASRAADILSSELMTSSQTSVKSLPYVNSEIISEALSLRCWLGEIQKTCVSSIDTQRALFMNPTNAVARQSIVFEANATSARN